VHAALLCQSSVDRPSAALFLSCSQSAARAAAGWRHLYVQVTVVGRQRSEIERENQNTRDIEEL